VRGLCSEFIGRGCGTRHRKWEVEETVMISIGIESDGFVLLHVQRLQVLCSVHSVWKSRRRKRPEFEFPVGCHGTKRPSPSGLLGGKWGLLFERCV